MLETIRRAQDLQGLPRTRTATPAEFFAALEVEPYERGTVLPHERTHAGPKEGRLRLLKATRTQLEPIFLLWDGTIEVDGLGEPDIVAEEGGVTARLWRLDLEFGDVVPLPTPVVTVLSISLGGL